MRIAMLLSWALALCTTLHAQSPQKLAYIQSEDIIQAMPEYQKAQSDLKAYAQQLEKQLVAAQNKAQEHYKSVMDSMQRDMMSPRAQQAAEARLQQMQTDLQQSAMSSERRLAERETSLVEPLYERFNKAVEAVAKREGYTYVLDKKFMVYSTAGIDATALVKKELGISN